MKLKPITAIAVLLLVIVASLSVAGCTETTQPYSNPSAQATATPTVTAIPTSAVVLEQVSAVKVMVPQQIGIYAPKAGNKFVGFNVTIKNIAADVSNSNPFNWQLRDTTGNIYAPGIATYSDAINGLKNLNTQPGDKVSGVIVFEVPQNATLKSLTYNGPGRTIINL